MKRRCCGWGISFSLLICNYKFRRKVFARNISFEVNSLVCDEFMQNEKRSNLVPFIDVSGNYVFFCFVFSHLLISFCVKMCSIYFCFRNVDERNSAKLFYWFAESKKCTSKKRRHFNINLSHTPPNHSLSWVAWYKKYEKVESRKQQRKLHLLQVR